jgi:hypothetical protein
MNKPIPTKPTALDRAAQRFWSMNPASMTPARKPWYRRGINGYLLTVAIAIAALLAIKWSL